MNSQYGTQNGTSNDPKSFAKKVLTNKWVILVLAVLLVVGFISLAIDVIVWLAGVVFSLAGLLILGVLIAIVYTVVRAKLRRRN